METVAVRSMVDLVAGVKRPGGQVEAVEFKRGCVVPVDGEVWEQLRKKNAIKGHLAIGNLKDVSASDGNAVVDGEKEIVADTLAPLQAYASAVGEGADLETAAQAAEAALAADPDEQGRLRKRNRR